jgi:hypothetical protein
MDENHDDIILTWILSKLFVLIKERVHTYNIFRFNDNCIWSNEGDEGDEGDGVCDNDDIVGRWLAWGDDEVSFLMINVNNPIND